MTRPKGFKITHALSSNHPIAAAARIKKGRSTLPRLVTLTYPQLKPRFRTATLNRDFRIRRNINTALIPETLSYFLSFRFDLALISFIWH